MSIPLIKDPANVQDWKLSYEFHFEGLWDFSASVEGLVQIQDVDLRNIEMKYEIRIELVHELYGTCFQYDVKN